MTDRVNELDSINFKGMKRDKANREGSG